SGLPYIPGSSIKGLIRTAILENLRLEDEKKGDRAIRYDLRKSSNYELKLLENDYNSIQKVQNDPFKFLKISDFELQDSETYFGTSRIINKSGEGKGIPVYTEMTNAYFFDQKEVIAKGTISIEDNLTLKYWDNGKNKEFNYEDVFDIKRIFKNIDAFYNKITKTETHNNIIGIIDLINDNYFEDEALIRIGRFTQIESKTFKIERENEFYDRKTRDGRRIPLPKDINITGGVSRTLIDGEISAGWCILSITDKKKVNKKEINTNQKTINIKTSENMKPINDIKNKNDSNSQFRNIQKLKEGEIIEVTITAIKPFGAFAKTETGNSGLIHITKITNERVINIEDYLKVGNKEKVKVLEKTEKGWQFSIKDVKNDYDKYLYKED
ncbi:MAG: type III-A CRISPR-associated RAMP protein Csm5, partial [Spirochaetes bacterium]|nr:type III-A CRISPR-associated RAMP protein Csm5 [Spirochaetota bacterium]